MLKLFKNLFSVISVITKSLFRKKNFSPILISVMGLVIITLFCLYMYKDKTSGQNFYSIPSELIEEIIIDNETVALKFKGMPSISSDGRYIAYNDIVIEGREIKDINICLYDRVEKKEVSLPGLNSKGWDVSPSISKGARFIAFQSNRTGKHFWNIYLYDTKSKSLVSLPGLNSIMPELNPNISGDGKLITFASLRSRKMQVYLYNRKTKEVSPVPAL